MRWYGKDIYCNRGETFALDVGISSRDGTPYRIHTALNNAFLLLTVKSSAYSQKNRYVFRNWINLSNFPKVDDMTILDVDALPLGDALIRHRVLRYNDKYYIYDDDKLQYVEYGVRLIHTFDTEITRNWIDKTYLYDLKLVSGDLKAEYIETSNNGLNYDDVPLENINYEFHISDGKIYVNSDGGN